MSRPPGKQLELPMANPPVSSKNSVKGSQALTIPKGATRQKIERLREPTLYEKVVFKLGVLIPEEDPEDMVVPLNHFLQQVHYDKVHRWRVVENEFAGFPEYLTDHKDLDKPYVVFKEKEGILPLFDSTSVFLRKWDMLSLVLLLFTASVTPFETAYVASTNGINIDVLFLINRVVDLIFAFDMFIQARTPYRDPNTGKIIRDGKSILIRYLKTWFIIDLLSVIPFELTAINSSQQDPNIPISKQKGNLTQLRLLRFLRLMRLLKLLRVLRASRKLKQWRVYIDIRYTALQLVKLSLIIIFIIHWIACGYRLANDQNDPSDPIGWLDRYAQYRYGSNATASQVDKWEAYICGVYWSSATLSLVGPAWSTIAPASNRELGYAFFANFVAYILALYMIATLSNVLMVAQKVEREHDLRVDNYLEMFGRLKLDTRLKIKVHEYLSDHFAVATNQAYTNLLNELPAQLHGFITMEMFVDFISQVPYLEPFISREPLLAQELCRHVEIRSYPPNALVFDEGYEGIYYLKHGIMAIGGRVYPSGKIFGRTCLRTTNKLQEGRALTNCTLHVLPRTALQQCLSKHRKIEYYAKRWIWWQLTRRYIWTYTELYYKAAKRGLENNPPVFSERPNLKDGEWDVLDEAVLEYIVEYGY